MAPELVAAIEQFVILKLPEAALRSTPAIVAVDVLEVHCTAMTQSSNTEISAPGVPVLVEETPVAAAVLEVLTFKLTDLIRAVAD